MKAPNINTAKGLAKLIQAQIQLAKIGEATGDEFNWENIIKDYAKKQVKLFSSKPVVSGSAIKPPLGLIPKRFYDERIKAERFNEVCGAIARYYDAGLKINIEWIEEYNELVECVGKHHR